MINENDQSSETSEQQLHQKQDGFDIIEYPWKNDVVSIETFATRKMAFNEIFAHQELMEQRHQYIMACIAGFSQLIGYIHESGEINYKFDVIKMLTDYRRSDEYELFISTRDFPYNGIFKSFGCAGFYVLLDNGSYFHSHYAYLNKKTNKFVKKMKRHMKRMAIEAEIISNSASSETRLIGNILSKEQLSFGAWTDKKHPAIENGSNKFNTAEKEKKMEKNEQ